MDQEKKEEFERMILNFLIYGQFGRYADRLRPEIKRVLEQNLWTSYETRGGSVLIVPTTTTTADEDKLQESIKNDRRFKLHDLYSNGVLRPDVKALQEYLKSRGIDSEAYFQHIQGSRLDPRPNARLTDRVIEEALPVVYQAVVDSLSRALE